MLPSWSLVASLVSHSVDTKVLFSEIMNQITLFTATNNYDYVLYISHVICMLLRLLRGYVLHHSIEKKMERKPSKISQCDSPKLQWKAQINKYTCTWLNYPSCYRHSHIIVSYRIKSYVFVFFLVYLIKGNDKQWTNSFSYSPQRWTHIRVKFPRNTNWTSLS
jgi:hypothetical protein